MSGPPAFLSFPDLSEGSKGGELVAVAGPSSGAVPSFSSFPDFEIEKPASRRKNDKQRERNDRSAEKDDRGEESSKRRRRDEDESARRHRHHREHERERVSSSSRRDRDVEESGRSSRHDREEGRSRSMKEESERHKDQSGRQRRREIDEKERQRDRSRDHRREKRDRDRDRGRDREEGREGAEKRSRHDKGDERDRDERRREKEQRRARDRKGAEALKANEPDDGRAWYETAAAVEKKPAVPVSHFLELGLPKSNSLNWFEDVVGEPDVLRYREVSTRNPLRYYRDFGELINVELQLTPRRWPRFWTPWKHPSGEEPGACRFGGFAVWAPIRELGGQACSSQQVPRYSARAIDGSLHKARLLMRPKVLEGDLDADFLPLDSGRRRALAEVEDDLPAYRAISKDAGEDDDNEYDDMVAVLGDLSTIEDDLKAQRAEYERELKARPDDIERWINYSIMHLKSAPDAQGTGDASDPSKAPQTRANAEVTLAVLQRAFDAHRNNFASTDLHIAFLQAAESLWPPTKVTERWKNVILELGRTVPEEEMMKVYLTYIDWREGQGIGGTGSAAGGVDEVVAVYTECIDRLSSIGEPYLKHALTMFQTVTMKPERRTRCTFCCERVYS